MAAAANPKTVRLVRGKHLSPERGVCVMELASMLDGGAFTDRPASVSPVVAALLRCLNDAVGDERRRHLLPYAVAVLGSRGGGALERARMARLLDALDAAHRAQPAWRRLLAGRPRRPDRPLGPTEIETAAMALVRLHERRRDHGAVLRLVDALLALQGPARMPAPDLRPRPAARTARPRPQARA